MLVHDIIKNQSGPVRTIRTSRSVQHAIDKLVAFRIGSLLVEDDEGILVGIITERDILNECARCSEELGMTKVEEVMTIEMVTGDPTDRVSHLLNVMTENRIRHLPIMDGDRMLGLVSIGDLVKSQLDTMASENQHLREYIQHG